ncbi:hypothetical protein XENORESO_004828 [Xenotaenia resolanae]|uniref:Uncharacterized protein n=1 Tax=Xenotaenia resolanae TaxID=208358 RepID=A0ABV0WDY2_9TELE
MVTGGTAEIHSSGESLDRTSTGQICPLCKADKRRPSGGPLKFTTSFLGGAANVWKRDLIQHDCVSVTGCLEIKFDASALVNGLLCVETTVVHPLDLGAFVP